MASLAEFRTSHFPSYENPYAAFVPNVPFDASMMASMAQHQHQGSAALDFLSYADQLLNTFAATKNGGHPVGLSTDAVLHGMKARDFMEQFLPDVAASGPYDTNALMASGLHPTDFIPSSSYLPTSQHMAAFGAGPYSVEVPSSTEDHAPWLAGGHYGVPSSGAAVSPAKPQSKYHASQQHSHPALPIAVKRQEWRLCVKAPTLGTFYLFTDPEKSIGEMIPDIESKIRELYHTSVRVHLVQDDHGIDLPFSFLVSSVLEDRALICVQYVRTDASSQYGSMAGHYTHHQPHHPSSGSSSPSRSPSHGNHSPHSSPSPTTSDQSSPQSPFFQSYSSPQQSGSLPATPCSQGEGQLETGVRFQEPPPTKVLQNKEFSFTVSVKNLKNNFATFSSHNPLEAFAQQTDNDLCSAESGAFFAPISVPSTNNPWGAPVPMPVDDGEDNSNSTASCLNNCEIPIEVLIEEEGGGVLNLRDFRIRCSVLDKQEGLYVFFVKLKKNSHYGRTRFIIRVRRKQPTKQERNMDYVETNLMHNHHDREPQMKPGNDLGGGARADLLVSHPIVVISKERKTKRKRGKLVEQN